MPPSWSDAERAEVLTESLIRPRDAFVPFPTLRHVRRPGWEQLITPAFGEGGLNEVTLCAVAEAEVDQVITRTLAEYAALGLRFRWLVGPDSRPADLAERLAARGMIASRCAIMAARAADLGALAAPPGVTVTRVAPTPEAIAGYAAVLAAGWGMDPAPVAAYHLAAATDPRDRHAFFLASVDGEPAAAAGGVHFERSLHLQGAVVLPRFRGRGVYRALIGARVALARDRGVDLFTTQARAETSAPILEKLGFTRFLELPTFLNR